MNRLYHRVPDKIVGDRLCPLNSLKQINAEVAALQERKYDSRKHLMAVRLPILDCLWNDVIHLSPLHPTKIREALLQTGHLQSPSSPLKFFIIDPKKLEPGKAVFFRHSKDTQEKYDFLESDFSAFEADRYQELPNVPEEQIEYYRLMKAKGSRPLLWARTPHVFYKGEIVTTGLGVIQW